MIDKEHSEGRSQRQSDSRRQKKITEALSPTGLWANIGDQCEYGCMEDGQADTLKNPHYQKGPKRRRPKIGNRGDGKEESAGHHK